MQSSPSWTTRGVSGVLRASLALPFLLGAAGQGGHAAETQGENPLLAREFVFPMFIWGLYENPSPDSNSMRIFASPRYAMFGVDDHLYQYQWSSSDWSGPEPGIAARIELKKVGEGVRPVDGGHFMPLLRGKRWMSRDGNVFAALGGPENDGTSTIWIGTASNWHSYFTGPAKGAARALGSNPTYHPREFEGVIIRVDDLEDDELDPHTRKLNAKWRDIALSGDGTRLLYHAAAWHEQSAIHRATLKLFDTATGELVSEMDRGIDGRRVPIIHRLTLNHDGTKAFAHCIPKDGPAFNHVLTTDTFEKVGRWRGLPDDVRFSPDGRWLVTSIRGYLCLTDCQTGELFRLTSGESGSQFEFTSDSKALHVLSSGVGNVPEDARLLRERCFRRFDIESLSLKYEASLLGYSRVLGPALLSGDGMYVSAVLRYKASPKATLETAGLVWMLKTKPQQLGEKLPRKRVWKTEDGRSAEATFDVLSYMPGANSHAFLLHIKTENGEEIELPWAKLGKESREAAFLLTTVLSASEEN